ncbi:hypothetical protein [Candidatus Sulfurimonas baltica]|uniref:Uncharacterized protein n=1 Tax=Candidatus Sulfurimonas baltica TaxID=2740404 RepID=A0A7S7LTT2_9BACT|nr:hypothetical protein [Candidatus Sulfurimonas baltica]QOY51396.1 hypothetical protein HUE88_09730 [Candidatus Sulfurimonas baltica]
MFVKMNILDIVKNNFKTFVDARSGKIIKKDITVFIIIPLIISILVLYSGFSLGKENSNIFLTAFSIFSALLFNMLFILFDIISKTVKENDQSTETRRLKVKLLKETFTNISFTVLLSVGIVISLLFFVIFIDHKDMELFDILQYKITLNGIVSLIVIYLITMFSMSFLMVLKRIDILLSNEI